MSNKQSSSSAFFKPGFGGKAGSKSGDKGDGKSGDKSGYNSGNKTLEVPAQTKIIDYMEGVIFYHGTHKCHADNIMTKGINPDQQGNVNALGDGFYTVKKLADVWKWMHPDLDALNDKKTDQERKIFLSQNLSVIVIEIVAAPTKVYEGKSGDAEVIDCDGDVLWTKSGTQHIKVRREITGKAMLSEPSFEAWYQNNFKLKEKV
ncbi:hypothetical protein ABW20_dc0101841 [Dactylellina cionopaga]|nr:hypothetical protein ABW20_dc0101841 [Dactylellina cionopaga]